MALDIAAAGAGLVLVGLTLQDIFTTVVVPGGSQGPLQIGRRCVFVLLPVWRRRRSGRGVSAGFAPFAFAVTFVIWLFLLVLGFGLLVFAVRGAFTPPVGSLAEGMYLAASAMGTLGIGDAAAAGLARWVVVTAGFCGLAAMTMAITYLLEVQQSIAQRDAGILKLTTSAGQPPSGVALLERYGDLGCRDELPKLLRSGRDWCNQVLQTHASHPWLIYFRSVSTDAGWPAALGALMDAALILELLVDQPDARGAAILLSEDGRRMARELSKLIGLRSHGGEPSPAEMDRLCGQLRAAGYELRQDAALADFRARRSEHAGPVAALSEHLGTPPAPLAPA